MITFIEKKRESYLSLLEITDEMNKILQSGDLESIHKAVSSRDDIIRRIAAIDEGIPALEKIDGGREIDEVLALIEMIAELNELMINDVSERLNTVGKELSELSRGAKVAAQYARIGAI